MLKQIKLFYGRRSSHISPDNRAFIEKNKHLYFLELNDFKTNVFSNIIEAYKNINLEIGFGSGYFINQSAIINPNAFYLGVEAYVDGVLNLLKNLTSTTALSNIKIYNDNLYNILDYIPNNIISNIYILFPDPWPKTRHHKRRIISQHNLNVFANILKKDGIIRFASDHFEYSEYCMLEFEKNSNFKLLKQYTEAPKDHFITKYETKALRENKTIAYLDFIKQ